jgi:CelD/BcsL family acetyltransferase involved in cellulose biosynthesis
MNKELYQINKYHSIKVVRNVEEFVKLRDTWDCLAEKCESYTPWLSFDWFNLCLKYSLDMNELLVLLVYREDNVVAIAPFSVQHAKYKGILKTRKIELIGNVQSPIRNFLFGDSDDKEKKDILSSIFSFFCNVYQDWDIIEIDTIPEEYNVFSRLKDVLFDSGLEYRSYFCTGNWYLDGIDYSFKQYFQNLSKKLRKDIEYCKRRLQKMGDLRAQIEPDNGFGDRYLNFYDELRTRSWKEQEKDKSFNRDFIKLAAKHGWLRMAILFYGDVPIALQRWVVCRKIAYIVSVLHDEHYKKYSPGKILSSEISQYVIDHDKVIEIDFMKGDEPYKKYWTPQRRERKGVTIFNHSYRGHFLAFLMTRVLPFIERHQRLTSVRKRLQQYLTKRLE